MEVLQVFVKSSSDSSLDFAINIGVPPGVLSHVPAAISPEIHPEILLSISQMMLYENPPSNPVTGKC